ncbi:MAG: hypothetical protein B6245_03290 [Desulfobacteraceae bacterium 4572_88]|nr:MAG: hypothetical protein B6245_03290 [Desulfobacteraceae bacterium 4572_88]
MKVRPPSCSRRTGKSGGSDAGQGTRIYEVFFDREPEKNNHPGCSRRIAKSGGHGPDLAIRAERMVFYLFPVCQDTK